MLMSFFEESTWLSQDIMFSYVDIIGSVDDHLLLIVVMSEIENLTEISVFMKNSELGPPRHQEMSELKHLSNIKFPLRVNTFYS